MLISQLFKQLQIYNEVIFDLDNTLYDQQDFDRGAFEVIEDVLIKKGHINSKGIARFLLSHKQLKGNKHPTLFNDALSEFHLPQSLFPLMLKYYTEHNGCYITIKNSLIPLIKKHLIDQKIFIVTNGQIKVQTTKLTCLAAQTFAKTVICSPSELSQLKPNRFAFDELSKYHTFINPVMVGDDLTTDGLFAKHINIPFIHFDISQAK